MITNNYPIGTVENVTVTVTADRTLDSQAVWISIDNGTTWHACTWIGSPGLKRQARTTNPVTFSLRTNGALLVKVNDNPDVPIMKAGFFSVG